MGKGGCYDPPLDFVIFCPILAFLVSNERFWRILHSAEKFFEKKLIFDEVKAFKCSDDVTISDFPVAARKSRIFR